MSILLVSTVKRRNAIEHHSPNTLVITNGFIELVVNATAVICVDNTPVMGEKQWLGVAERILFTSK